MSRNRILWLVVAATLAVIVAFQVTAPSQDPSRFIAQAEDALTTRNLALARSLADKALVVAAQLAPR